MVIHHPPERLRRNSDQPTALTNVLVATAGSSSRTGEVTLRTPTCSARSRQGGWALYPNGAEVVVVHPGGALVGPPAEVAGELGRVAGGGLDRAAAWAIRRFLTDPAAHDPSGWPAPRARAWSRPASGYWLSGPTNQPGSAGRPSSWPEAPARPPLPQVVPIPAHPAQPHPSPAPAPQRAA